MLAVVKASSLDALIDEVVPPAIRLDRPLSLPPAQTEYDYLRQLRATAARNRVCRSLIGLGYADTITPPVILRNVFENPGWYTPYTPYQAEIAQGRLESLLNFQTMVRDLTGMDVANASLLDEPTAAAEAMTLVHRMQPKRAAVRNTFLVSSRTWPQTRAVLQSRAEPLGLTVREVDPSAVTFDEDVFGLLVQYPDECGRVDELSGLIARAHEAGVLVTVATDLLALTLLTPPGEARRRRRRRQLAAVWRAAGVRRAARGVFRDQGRVRAAGAGSHHRRVGRQQRPPGVPDGPADARAAHPTREGDLEHLHRAGAAGQHGGDVRGLPRPRRAARDCDARQSAGVRARHRARDAGIPPAQRPVLRHAPCRDARSRRRRSRRQPRKPASTCA